MADDFRVEIRGLAELAAGTRKLAGEIEQEAPRAFATAARSVAADVSAAVPRRTGRLAGSVNARPIDGGASVSMGDGVPYAQYVEYGGRGHPHSASGNYLYPAAMDAGPRLQQAGEQAAEAAIGGMSWPSP